DGDLGLCRALGDVPRDVGGQGSRMRKLRRQSRRRLCPGADLSQKRFRKGHKPPLVAMSDDDESELPRVAMSAVEVPHISELECLDLLGSGEGQPSERVISEDRAVDLISPEARGFVAFGCQ